MKILVVDDETDVKFLFEQHFRKEIRSLQMEFMFAFSGDEALNYLNEHGHEAVLILSDINMPGMSGLQLLRRIKETYEAPSPHVMMMTAYGDDENYSHAMKSGADDFLTKPVDFTALKEKLKSVADAT
jgi:CheY-like chemotaxis protein